MPVETDKQVLAKSNQQRLADIHWDVRGPGQVLQKFDSSGKVVGSTTKDLEASWAAANHQRTWEMLTEALKRLEALPGKVADAVAAKLGAGVTIEARPVEIDYELLATAVADKLAARLKD